MSTSVEQGRGAHPPEDRARSRLSVLRLLLDLLVFQVGVRVIFETLTFIDPWWRSSLLDREPRYLFELPAMVAAMVIGVLVILPLARRVSSGDTLANLGLRRVAGRSAWAAAAAITAVGIGIASASTLVIPSATAATWRTLHVTSRGDLFLFVAIVAPIFAALAEELTYRGVVQSSLERVHTGWGPVATILLFVGAHLYQGFVSIVLFVLPLALLFTAARRRDPSLAPLMVAHLIIDAAVFSGFFLIDARPDLRTIVAVPALGLCALVLLLTRQAMSGLVVETTAWVRTLFSRRAATRHLPWTVAFAAGAGAIAAGVHTPNLPLPLPYMATAAVLLVAAQALHRARSRRTQRREQAA